MNPRARRDLNVVLAAFSRAGYPPPLVTSTDRTQTQQNAQVASGRGVPVSKHVYGLAADIVQAPSWRSQCSLTTLAGIVRAWLPYVEAFPHGVTGRPADHVHIEWPWNL